MRSVSKNSGRDVYSPGLEGFYKGGHYSGRPKPSYNIAFSVHAGLFKDKDILKGYGVAFHTHYFGDSSDLTGSVL